MWILYFGLLLVPESKANDFLGSPAGFIIFVAIFTSYLFLVLWVLPGLILGNKYTGFKFYLISWLLGCGTVGIIPVILYWIRVDKNLSKYASSLQEK